jgi:hypothetical protein
MAWRRYASDARLSRAVTVQHGQPHAPGGAYPSWPSACAFAQACSPFASL